jgi:hypothetical protein
LYLKHLLTESNHSHWIVHNIYTYRLLKDT